MIRYLKSLIKNTHYRLSPTMREKTYYTDLFTRDPAWSLPEPNHEEILRWNIIRDFICVVQDELQIQESQCHILDIGCGRGWLSNLLSGHGQVVGIEPVKPVVKWANKLFPLLDIRHGRAKDLIKQGKVGYFDLIVCSEVIEHIHNKKKRKFIDEINLLLRESGYLIITTPRKEAEEDWRKYGSPGQPIEDWLNEEEVRLLLIGDHFQISKLSRLSIPPSPNAPPIEIYQLWLAQKLKK